MSTIQDATQAEVAALNKALIKADKSVQGFAQGDPKSSEVGDSTDTDVTAVISAAQAAGYNTVPAGEAAVSDGDSVTVSSQGTSTASATIGVTSGAVTGVTFSAGTDGIVSDGDTLSVTGGTVTLSVTAGVVTASYTAA